ncbi:MAG TPA: GntR family transcriptional regulator [Steroidobacteraceae bacterium]|nr:GntR family transcriptional regulator [Steroidobacteraceae bacterium]
MNEPLARTMTGQITARIREKILTGTYAPGSPLLQDSIAAEFGVSKIPVREALVQLRSEGLVDIFAHRGFQVRAISASEMVEVFRLRLAIEPAAVAEGARKASAGDRAAAATAWQALNQALATGDLKNSGDLNSAFHLSLVVPRLQPVTSETLARLHTLAQRYVRMHLQPAGRVKRAMKEHTALHEAWAAQDAKEARRLCQAHIEETLDELADALSPKLKK